MAAASVARTSSRARLRSGSGLTRGDWVVVIGSWFLSSLSGSRHRFYGDRVNDGGQSTQSRVRSIALCQARVPASRASWSIEEIHRRSSCQLAREVLRGLPDADGQAGGVPGAERSRLGDHGPDHVDAEDVGLELHRQSRSRSLRRRP